MTFAIVNLRNGVQRDVVPFLLDNDAFPILENAYLFRGRIQRRSCFTFVGNDGRLKGNAGTTDGAGVLALLDATVGTGIPEGVAQFVMGGNTYTDPGGASPVALIRTGGVAATLDRVSGLTAGPAATAVTYFPGLPVMGLKVWEQTDLNDERLFAFDTRYSYLFNQGTNEFEFANTFAGTVNTFVWTGTNSDFFWSTNYYNAFWATNNTAGFHALENISPVAEGDGIRWYGTVGAVDGWRNFNPGLNGTSSVAATNFLTGGLIILPYKDRLVVLNTLEGTSLATSSRFAQRARWSQNGTPFYNAFPDGFSSYIRAWSEIEVGRGGFIDAPTQEHIVSAQFIKDTLVVFFERSTWQLVYTANELLPFIWKKINAELGSESTFSIVGFDSGVFGVGNYGIISSDSVSVLRIDQKIPDEVFQIQNKNNGVKRVHGIRDYTAQLVYWTIPTLTDEDNQAASYEITFPNQVLVYNYLDGSWAEFDDSFTNFGYWQRFSDITWAQLTRTWESSNFSWNSGVLQARFPDVIAGNQRGFVVVYSQLQNLGQNSPSIPISNFTAPDSVFAPDHNFVSNDYVLITGVQGTVNINNLIYRVASTIDKDNFTIDTAPYTPLPSGTYTGGGLLTHIPNFEIRTKEFNPFYQDGKSVRLNYFDIYLDRTEDGELQTSVYTSSNDSNPIETQSILTRPEPSASFSSNQERIFHRSYSNAFGSFFQNVFTLNDTQMRDLDITTSDVKIHGLIYYTNPSGRTSYDL